MTVTAPEKIEVREAVELDPRVRRGAAFLDEWEDGWAQKIDLGRFALVNCEACVVGQVLGDFVLGAARWREVLGDAFDVWSRQHGFLGDGGQGLSDWEALERDWVTIIRQRQAEHA